MTTSIDLLANAERQPHDRPPSRDDGQAPGDYWAGSVHDEIARWRNRALAAEAEATRLRCALTRSSSTRRCARG
jgi:hypothetical protein